MGTAHVLVRRAERIAGRSREALEDLELAGVGDREVSRETRDLAGLRRPVFRDQPVARRALCDAHVDTPLAPLEGARVLRDQLEPHLAEPERSELRAELLVDDDSER